jgi:hypothetical protein
MSSAVALARPVKSIDDECKDLPEGVAGRIGQLNPDTAVTITPQYLRTVAINAQKYAADMSGIQHRSAEYAQAEHRKVLALHGYGTPDAAYTIPRSATQGD